MTSIEVADRGKALYECKLRAQLEPAEKGRFVVIDVRSGDFEVGDDYLQPTKTVRARNPNALLHTIRIGHPVAGRIGGRFST